MPTKVRVIAFALACAVGVGSTFFSSAFEPKGFSREEARAKLGRRVKLKASSRDADPRIINTGVVAFTQVSNGERLLFIEWDEKLPGWVHRVTQIDRKSYQALIAEE